MNDNKAQAAYHPDQPPGDSMTTNQERAAEIIWDEQASGIVKPRDLAEALADAGLLAPELPEASRDGLGSGEWSAGFQYQGRYNGDFTITYEAHASAWAPGEISISAPRIMRTDDAEALALAILAAVKSDRGQK